MQKGSPVQWPESRLTANVEPPLAISRSATALGPRRLETLAENEPADALALERGEIGEAFAHHPPETLALERGELSVAFTHHAPETLALERGELSVAFTHHSPETLALERGELGVAFTHHAPETLAFGRGKSAHAALADAALLAALLAIKSRRTQRRA